MFLLTDFTGKRLKSRVQLLKIFATDLKNQCFKNWTKP
jgi:hypothetical protein